MPSRRELQGVACGLLGRFVSRNNDLGGYWALGKLYGHARESGVFEIRIDLIRSVISPPNTEFHDLVAQFRQMLAVQLAARRLPAERLRGADIRVTFNGEKSVQLPGDVFECLVTLIDDLGRTYQVRGSGACWVHDPVKERKSARASPVSDPR